MRATFFSKLRYKSKLHFLNIISTFRIDLVNLPILIYNISYLFNFNYLYIVCKNILSIMQTILQLYRSTTY